MRKKVFGWVCRTSGMTADKIRRRKNRNDVNGNHPLAGYSEHLIMILRHFDI